MTAAAGAAGASAGGVVPITSRTMANRVRSTPRQTTPTAMTSRRRKPVPVVMRTVTMNRVASAAVDAVVVAAAVATVTICRPKVALKTTARPMTKLGMPLPLKNSRTIRPVLKP